MPFDPLRDAVIVVGRSHSVFNACRLFASGLISIHIEPSEIATSKSGGTSVFRCAHCSDLGKIMILSAIPSGTSVKSVNCQVCVFQYTLTSKFV